MHCACKHCTILHPGLFGMRCATFAMILISQTQTTDSTVNSMTFATALELVCLSVSHQLIARHRFKAP